MDATLTDLELELWWRRRNDGTIKWTDREGKKTPINEMSDTHLKNTISFIRNQQEKEIMFEEALSGFDTKWLF